MTLVIICSTELFTSTTFHPFTRASADRFSICVQNCLFVFRLMRCKRVENPAWGTVEFIDESAPTTMRTKSCSAPSQRYAID